MPQLPYSRNNLSLPSPSMSTASQTAFVAESVWTALYFDKDGKLQEQIKFDCPTMMTIDKKGEGDAVLRQLDCIEIDSNDVPLDDVGMTPSGA